MNNNQISNILRQPQYQSTPISDGAQSTLTKNLGSPAQMSKIKKRQLDEAEVSNSPFKKRRITEYGKDPLSRKAISFKKEQNITTGRNVAIVVFQSPKSKKTRYTIASTEGLPGNTHSELRALDQLPPNVDKIYKVYTEREPCQKGSDCHRKLKGVLSEETEIVYSSAYPADPKARSIAEKEFKRKQENLGIRAPKCSKKLNFEF